MNSFFKAYLILMKLISISQFYAPEPCLIHAYSFVAHGETLQFIFYLILTIRTTVNWLVSLLEMEDYLLK